ncbi:AzlD domain-containing protein [Clostridium cylindrosporum]|uniref:Branched-chain amino acid transport n=1 Tax=Clostridium cylindrosporum DSM 605 TaxID=1121307 RepID=A0A0J8G3A5_CLOCY|nr:AzlD domain-containing protein [Clostridium cylindrosporum]KMT22191.1 branched-chain amino acid transport [Clostridium cylindrosporum DSM 605]
MDRIIISVLIMAFVSYLPRVIPLLFMKKDIESKFLQSFLFYMPYAVLGAMCFPSIIYSTGNVTIAVIGTFAALVLAFLNQGLLKTSIFTVVFVYICGLFI